jgi:hypothetical protein
MGDQQNPDGIYVPPGVNRRYPLEHKTERCYCDGDCSCFRIGGVHDFHDPKDCGR